MDIKAGQSDIIVKTKNESIKSRGHRPEELKKAGDIASKDTTANDPATRPPNTRESFHLPGGEENTSFLSDENTRPRQPLPREEVRSLPGAFSVPGIRMQDHWQETLSDDGSEDPRDSLPGYQILNDDDEESHVNDEFYVIPEAERVEFTQTELETRVAMLDTFVENVNQPWTLKRIAILVVVLGVLAGLIVIIILVAELNGFI